MSAPEIETTSASSGTVLGMRSDVYERHWELTWMTKDDVETFETRFQDKALFKDLAYLFLGAGIPLGLDKSINFFSKRDDADLAILIVCIVLIVLGCIFAKIAHSRSSKIQTFKQNLFKQERMLSSRVTMVNSGSSDVTPIRAA
jgi:hypothetical protein